MTHVTTSHCDGVLTLAIDNPPLNILTQAVLAEIRTALHDLADDSSVRVLVLTAAGKHFSAGADVREHLPGAFEKMIPEFMETVDAIRTFPVPVIASVTGKCLGGGFELAMAADLIAASDTAAFGQPEILLGVIPPAACVLLPRLIPPGTARYLIMSGEVLTAEEARTLGLVHRTFAQDELEKGTLETARAIARNSRAALRIAKQAFLDTETRRTPDALSRATRLYLDDLMNTEDSVRGLRAFVDKQQPQWRHR